MEAFGSFLDHEECESLSKMFAIENSDVMLHYNESNLFSNYGEIPSTLLATGEYVAEVDENFFTFSSNHNLDTKFHCLSQESSYSSEIDSTLFPNEYHHQANGSVNYVTDHNNFVPIFPDDMMEEILQFKAEMGGEYQLSNEEKRPGVGDSCKEMQLKRKVNVLQISEEKSEDDSPDQRLKKKSRVSRNGQNNKRKGAQSKKEKKAILSNDEEESYGGGNGQTSSSCCSEDDSKASQEDNGGPINSESKGSASTCLNSTGKARASRGSATDPQSLYARRRRERINERLRILQNLVPNGTKVDISTMLEEAVGYVKFLQLQIKLLSSDDMWMYAPIAYNGMDMGLYEKMAPNLWS